MDDSIAYMQPKGLESAGESTQALNFIVVPFSQEFMPISKLLSTSVESLQITVASQELVKAPCPCLEVVEGVSLAVKAVDASCSPKPLSETINSFEEVMKVACSPWELREAP